MRSESVIRESFGGEMHLMGQRAKNPPKKREWVGGVMATIVEYSSRKRARSRNSMDGRSCTSAAGCAAIRCATLPRAKACWRQGGRGERRRAHAGCGLAEGRHERVRGKESAMKLWHAMFILTFIMVYGTLSLALLGSWTYESAKSLRNAPRPSACSKGESVA